VSHSFTLSAPSTLKEIKTPAFVSSAFDPTVLAANLHPPSIQFEAIWDTGASGTVVSQRIVDSCGLKPIGMVRVQTAGGVSNCEVHLINLTLPNGICFNHIRVTKADMGKVNLLIGMDVISRGDFAITNLNGQTCFSFRFPSRERIDFVQPAPIIVPPGIGRNSKCPCGSGKKYKQCCGKK
jgi:predicted aspartyl protease